MIERVVADRYRLLKMIGQGGMAVVHLAHDGRLDRDVAVKVLRPGFAEDPQFVDRFRREARHAASLHHPNIVTIYDTGTDPETGSDYIVMQLVDGPDLQDIIERSGPLGTPFAVRIGIETARALSFAHEHGIIHRDIKPANILIDVDGEVRVADFGIARAATDTGATTTGMIGSAQYASPEQVMGEEVGPRSDLYSLGVVLYEALTGVRPFDGPSPAAVALERLRVQPIPISSIEPNVPRSLEQIVMRLLERRPELRPASAAEVVAELDGFRVRELGGVRRTGSRPRDGARRGAVAASCVDVVNGGHWRRHSDAARPPSPERSRTGWPGCSLGRDRAPGSRFGRRDPGSRERRSSFGYGAGTDVPLCTVGSSHRRRFAIAHAIGGARRDRTARVYPDLHPERDPNAAAADSNACPGRPTQP